MKDVVDTATAEKDVDESGRSTEAGEDGIGGITEEGSPLRGDRGARFDSNRRSWRVAKAAVAG